MALIIAGHVRSGTTLLRNLCNRHPDITVTMEFDNFTGLGRSFRGYSRQVLRKWWRDRHRSFLVQGNEEEHWAQVLRSYVFVARYLFEVGRRQTGHIDVSTIEAALWSIFPTSRVVGDKMPAYVFRLDKLAETDGLVRVIVHRDCRDVTSSVLRMVRTKWRGQPWVESLDTAEKVANQWVQAIELMERYADKLHIVRYEDLVREPAKELRLLAERLGVDPDGFPIDMIKGGSIGKYQNGLSDEELATVVDIAGPTMARLGYL